MDQETLLKVEILYDLSKKCKELQPPKHALFSWKCPKCNNKLGKESLKEIVISNEASGIIKQILEDGGLTQGVYNMEILRYTCKCGYDYVKIETDTVGSDI